MNSILELQISIFFYFFANIFWWFDNIILTENETKKKWILQYHWYFPSFLELCVLLQHWKKVTAKVNISWSLYLNINFYSFPYFSAFFIVCVAVVDKFSQTLTADIKSNPKKIETKFREFCKGTKSKENRFVSKINLYKWNKSKYDISSANWII